MHTLRTLTPSSPKSSSPLFLTSALWLIAVLLSTFVLPAHADDAGPNKDATPPDVIVFNNGDQLTGKFVRAVSGNVVFHSDIAGDLTVGWDKVKEIRSANKFAVIEKGQPLTKAARAQVPHGAISVENQQMHINPSTGEPKTLPVKDAAYVIDEPTFNKEIRTQPGLLHGWSGEITGGASIVKATDNTTTFNGTAALVRTIPEVNWLDPRNRTSIGFNGSYGKITSPAFTVGGVTTPSTFAKTAIYHAEAERDQYFSPRFYVLAQTAFDHNFSQGLDLQQIYGGGVGWTVLKTPKQMLDVKATVQYEKQSFLTSGAGSNQDLIGSTFAANYGLKLPKDIVFTEQVSYIPAYNNSNAYSGNESSTLTLPVYKRLGLSVAAIDSYLNDPPASEPPTKRNSFQFTTGVTYSLGH
jgi:hypothetical protein